MPEPPEIFVLAGPNGAGKTTVAAKLLPEGGVDTFVNADFIARGLSPHDPDSTAFEAGRLMLTRLRELCAARATFGFETTLASKTFAPFLRDARRAGYLVHIFYVWLDEPELALGRVHQRVLEGGHDIPEDTILRRYTRSLVNFFQLYRPLADNWCVWDNSEVHLSPVAFGRIDGETIVLEPERWEWVTQQGGIDAG